MKKKKRRRIPIIETRFYSTDELISKENESAAICCYRANSYFIDGPFERRTIDSNFQSRLRRDVCWHNYKRDATIFMNKTSRSVGNARHALNYWENMSFDLSGAWSMQRSMKASDFESRYKARINFYKRSTLKGLIADFLVKVGQRNRERSFRWVVFALQNFVVALRNGICVQRQPFGRTL